MLTFFLLKMATVNISDLLRFVSEQVSKGVAYARGRCHELALWSELLKTFLSILPLARELIPACIGCPNWEVAAAGYVLRAKIRGLVEYYDNLKCTEPKRLEDVKQKKSSFFKEANDVEKFKNFVWVIYSSESDANKVQEISEYCLEQFGEEIFTEEGEESVDLNAGMVGINRDGKLILSYLEARIKETCSDLMLLGKLAGSDAPVGQPMVPRLKANAEAEKQLAKKETTKAVLEFSEEN